jgi:CRISPR-associated endonuclease Csn1
VKTEAAEIKKFIQSRFSELGINPDILEFNSDLCGQEFISQPSYQLWHLLYSYEGDNSASGNETLYKLLQEKFGFKREHATILSNIGMQEDYASLSAKAMKKMIPFLKAGHPYARKENGDGLAGASVLAGYNHSSSLNSEENEQRKLKDKLEILPKNSLRNPVVEKILNQMVNVVNAIIQDPNLGRPDEIRIELARELKKNAKERQELTEQINKANKEHEAIRELLMKEDSIANPTRNDIIRYKLYQELKNNGYKTLYSDTYIPREKLFSKEFDIEHILPKSRIFDDSFSNKTLESRFVNLKKGDQTAADFVMDSYGENGFDAYEKRVEMLYKEKEGGISKAKYLKLFKKSSEIGDGFIERDLRESQYIAKKAKEMLFEISRSVISTSGSITQRLREDWGLVNVMQELNISKYRNLGLTEFIEQKDGNRKERIIDWTKRNDHRHHAMDALTVAFTKHSHIQYLNHLNARKNEKDKLHASILGIENKETEQVVDDSGNKARKFKQPIPNFRVEAKKHLEAVLISFKAKNKVVTKNKNQIKTAKGVKTKIELTPRGQLHKETVYGSRKVPVFKTETVGAKFDAPKIRLVENKQFRSLLQSRLDAFGGDAKKAFTGKNSVDKNPIFISEDKTELMPSSVRLKWFEIEYTIRKDITPDNFKDYKNLEKVADEKVRQILMARLREFDGKSKEAFSNLDLNPIWLNREKGIQIKRTTITGVSSVEALHVKRDHLGKPILDKEGKEIPNDFVSTGNNHHVAIYRDANGDLQEKVVSFYEAVHRINQGLPIIDKNFNLDKDWQFLFTMKQNEYFVFPGEGFDPNEMDLLDISNFATISTKLFRVQKLATKDYFFRHHLETEVENNPKTKNITWKREGLKGINSIVKVRINHIGNIVHVGES